MIKYVKQKPFYTQQAGIPIVPIVLICLNDADFDVKISDAVWIINYVFINGHDPCDSDGDGIRDY